MKTLFALIFLETLDNFLPASEFMIVDRKSQFDVLEKIHNYKFETFALKELS